MPQRTMAAYVHTSGKASAEGGVVGASPPSAAAPLNLLVAMARQRQAKARSVVEAHEERARDNDGPRGVGFPPLAELIVEESWREALATEVAKPYFKATLQDMLQNEARAGKTLYPSPSDLFRALNACPLRQAKVVILGQDPYHGPNQAMGLCFSVPNGVQVPPSLQNIYKEIASDLGASRPTHGNLERWAAQGVLLLNTVLSVRKGEANSHAKRGWEAFTDACLRHVCSYKEDNAAEDDSGEPAAVEEEGGEAEVEPAAKRARVAPKAPAPKASSAVVFLLWGKSAQEKERIVKAAQTGGLSGAAKSSRALYVLKSPHPSGLSAHRGFFGCAHFSKANALLEKHGESPIAWADL